MCRANRGHAGASAVCRPNDYMSQAYSATPKGVRPLVHLVSRLRRRLWKGDHLSQPSRRNLLVFGLTPRLLRFAVSE